MKNMSKNKREKTNNDIIYFMSFIRKFIVIRNTVIGIVIIIVAIFSYVTCKRMFKVQSERTHQALTNQVLHIAELTTIKNNYSDIVCIKKSAVGGIVKAHSIIKVSGSIRIGVNELTRSKIYIDKKKNKVEIQMPHCVILDNTLISQEVFDERKSLFVPITTQEIFNEINSTMAEYSAKAEYNDLINEADARLIELVTATVKGVGFKDVHVQLISY